MKTLNTETETLLINEANREAFTKSLNMWKDEIQLIKESKFNSMEFWAEISYDSPRSLWRFGRSFQMYQDYAAQKKLSELV